MVFIAQAISQISDSCQKLNYFTSAVILLLMCVWIIVTENESLHSVTSSVTSGIAVSEVSPLDYDASGK